MISNCDSKAELLAALRAQDITLPLRSEGRNKDHIERWTLCRLLATLAAQDLIRFPFATTKRERPDFDLCMAGEQVGLEVSEALQANYAEHQKIQETEFPDSFMEPGHFRRGAVPQQRQREILAAGQLSAPPIMGDALEREWAEGVVNTIAMKQKKLASPGFQKRPVNWLSVMDSLFIHSDWIPKGLTFLRPLLVPIWSTQPSFDQIFIDHGTEVFVILSRDAQQIVPTNNLWRK